MTNSSPKQTALSNKKYTQYRPTNLRIPTNAEIAAARLCYPPTPPCRVIKSQEYWFDQEYDICMIDK